MLNYVYHVLIIISTLVILIKTIFYGIYEINTLSNKIGGVSVILFSIFVTVFTNIIVFL